MHLLVRFHDGEANRGAQHNNFFHFRKKFLAGVSSLESAKLVPAGLDSRIETMSATEKYLETFLYARENLLANGNSGLYGVPYFWEGPGGENDE